MYRNFWHYVTTFCNMLSNTHLKSVKNHDFLLSFKEVGWLYRCFTTLQHILGHFGRSQLTHSKRVHSCVMHSSISYLLNLQYCEQNLCECCPGNPITETPHIHKMLELHRNKAPWQQNSFHLKGLISHTHKRKVFLLIYLSSNVVLSCHVLYHINEREQR